jgi:hypothetical protein
MLCSTICNRLALRESNRYSNSAQAIRVYVIAKSTKQCRAAYARHLERFKRHLLAMPDTVSSELRVNCCGEKLELERAIVTQAVDVECWRAVDAAADAAQKVLTHARGELPVV